MMQESELTRLEREAEEASNTISRVHRPLVYTTVLVADLRRHKRALERLIKAVQEQLSACPESVKLAAETAADYLHAANPPPPPGQKRRGGNNGPEGNARKSG